MRKEKMKMKMKMGNEKLEKNILGGGGGGTNNTLESKEKIK